MNASCELLKVAKSLVALDELVEVFRKNFGISFIEADTEGHAGDPRVLYEEEIETLEATIHRRLVMSGNLKNCEVQVKTVSGPTITNLGVDEEGDSKFKLDARIEVVIYVPSASSSSMQRATEEAIKQFLDHRKA